ncbi:MAG TPA: hypothetical protein DC049_16640 [Spirochaetia bacterium]|nr:hypothetical protein [Spirochaetia bacterium]
MPNKSLKKKDDLLVVEVNHEGMLVNVASGTSSFLNETGLYIYKLIRKNKTDNEIASDLFKKYNVKKTELLSDIRAFRKDLKLKGVV